MTATMEQVLKDALALPVDFRLSLAERLVESVNAVPDPEIEQRQLAEVHRRMAEVQSERVELIPGEAALREVLEAVADGPWQSLCRTRPQAV